MERKEVRKRNYGITLIALVVTIVVILILTGVTISMITGENGILNMAKNSKEESNEVTNEELNTLDKYDELINKYTGNAREILEEKERSYGALVSNYSVKEQKWKIFHSDGKNIYLICDDYVKSKDVPLGQNGSTVTVNENEYRVSMNDVINDYIGGEDIQNNIYSQNLLKQYYQKVDIKKIKNKNIMATAYMLDTKSWREYTNEYAEYAIGGPTIELFRDSYNEIHTDKIETEVSSVIGYKIKGGPNKVNEFQTHIEGIPVDERNGLWIKSNKEKAVGMWIASPSFNASVTLINANFSGAISISNYDYEKLGFRPIVCLKSDVYLEKQTDGSYKII